MQNKEVYVEVVQTVQTLSDTHMMFVFENCTEKEVEACAHSIGWKEGFYKIESADGVSTGGAYKGEKRCTNFTSLTLERNCLQKTAIDAAELYARYFKDIVGERLFHKVIATAKISTQ